MAGFLGFASYALVALLILPLIISMAQLIRMYPSGGFYTYAAHEMHSVVGFLSAWTYFTSKLASALLLIHVFSSMIVAIIPQLHTISATTIDLVILSVFGWLNMYNLKTSRYVMYTFIVMKLIPTVCALVSCLYLYNYWNVLPETMLWSGIPLTIPLVLYAFTGFETSCSLSRSIIDADVNGPKAIFYSYGIVVCITVLYQFLFFLTAGPLLMVQESFSGAFPSLIRLLALNPLFASHLVVLLNIAIATSSLGGSYGILFSNHWNLYALAQHNHLPYSKWITTLNKHHIPFVCVGGEIIICIIYLLVTQGNQIALQQISVFGCTVAYTLSICGLLVSYRNKNLPYTARSIPFLAFGSCAFFIAACIQSFLLHGIASLFLFVSMVLFGLCLFWWQSYTKAHLSSLFAED